MKLIAMNEVCAVFDTTQEAYKPKTTSKKKTTKQYQVREFQPRQAISALTSDTDTVLKLVKFVENYCANEEMTSSYLLPQHTTETLDLKFKTKLFNATRDTVKYLDANLYKKFAGKEQYRYLNIRAIKEAKDVLQGLSMLASIATGELAPEGLFEVIETQIDELITSEASLNSWSEYEVKLNYTALKWNNTYGRIFIPTTQKEISDSPSYNGHYAFFSPKKSNCYCSLEVEEGQTTEEAIQELAILAVLAALKTASMTLLRNKASAVPVFSFEGSFVKSEEENPSPTRWWYFLVEEAIQAVLEGRYNRCAVCGKPYFTSRLGVSHTCNGSCRNAYKPNTD